MMTDSEREAMRKTFSDYFTEEIRARRKEQMRWFYAYLIIVGGAIAGLVALVLSRN